jgi:ABC-2 type transport system ATP-binding protein
VTPALELRSLTKRYDDGTLALENFDLEIPSGAFFGLLGPNGAGKTTAINAVCNLIRITSGEALVFGRPAHTLEARRDVGLAEQDINLDRFLTVRETLIYHGGYFGMSGADATARADEMIDVFDLRAKANTRTSKLSGGMRRRVLLARALMHRPGLVILDEPTAGVDIGSKAEIVELIRSIASGGKSVIVISSEPAELLATSDRILVLSNGCLAREISRSEIDAWATTEGDESQSSMIRVELGLQVAIQKASQNVH